jgi:putative transposase
MRRGHDAAFKARVAMEALKGEKTMAKLSSEFGVHSSQIRQWRQKLLEEVPIYFPIVAGEWVSRLFVVDGNRQATPVVVAIKGIIIDHQIKRPVGRHNHFPLRSDRKTFKSTIPKEPRRVRRAVPF